VCITLSFFAPLDDHIANSYLFAAQAEKAAKPKPATQTIQQRQSQVSSRDFAGGETRTNPAYASLVVPRSCELQDPRSWSFKPGLITRPGSRSTSSTSNSSDMFDRGHAPGTMGAAPPRPATPSRKRAYSHANVTPAKSSQNKSRRGNPNQLAGPDSSPPTALSSDRDDVSVIDLTG
jgi:hypothetical protein